MRWIVPVVVAILLGLVSTAQAELYQWVDENGSVHLSNTPPLDKNARKNVQLVEETKRPPAVLPKERKSSSRNEKSEKKALASNESGPASSKVEPSQKFKNASVEMYTTSWCGACAQARAYFRSRGISFADYDIEKDPEAAERCRSLNPKKSIPVLVINGDVIIGYSPSAYQAALEAGS